MAGARLGLAFGLIFCVLALGSADQLESFLSDKVFPLSSDAGLKVNINKLIDENGEFIENLLQKFDPAELPKIPLLGKGQLSNGWLSTLSRLKRSGDCYLTYADKVFGVDIKVGWEVLKYDYDYAYKLWFIPRNGKVHGSFEKIDVNLKVYIDLRNYLVVLEQFKFGKVGKLGLELEGTFGDKIRSWIGRLIINLAKKYVMHAVERISSKTIQEKMNEFNKQIPNENRQFRYIDLVEMNLNRFETEDDIEEEPF